MLVSVLVITGALAVGAWALFLRPDSDATVGTPVQIEIPSGASTMDIANRLSSAGVVANANMFRLQARLSKSDGDL
ncbi:MAG: aminodeoxychorismate lyase, partial [Coriobacteriia bacterium]|nr:aminodeoxychorismate lyase [Coriobacteriia bacterium]